MIFGKYKKGRTFQLNTMKTAKNAENTKICDNIATKVIKFCKGYTFEEHVTSQEYYDCETKRKIDVHWNEFKKKKNTSGCDARS